MRKFVSFCLLFWAVSAYADNGVINVPTSASVADAAKKMEALIKEKGLTLFALVSHTGGAGKVGLELRPTELIIFGNPKTGTPLMQCAQTVGLDLPMKVLVWEDDKGKVWMSYNDPAYIAKRHDLKDCAADMVKTVSGKLGGLVKAAAGAE